MNVIFCAGVCTAAACQCAASSAAATVEKPDQPLPPPVDDRGGTRAGSTKRAHSSVTQYVIQAARSTHTGRQSNQAHTKSIPRIIVHASSYATFSLDFEL